MLTRHQSFTYVKGHLPEKKLEKSGELLSKTSQKNLLSSVTIA